MDPFQLNTPTLGGDVSLWSLARHPPRRELQFHSAKALAR